MGAKKVYGITTYVKGPDSKRAFFFGPVQDRYYLNPQLYKDKVAIPLHNLGVLTVKTNQCEINTESALESLVTKAVKHYLSPTIRLGNLWLETEHIQFTVERDTE